MHINVETEIYEAIGEVLLPQITSDMIKIKIEYQTDGVFSYTKMYGINKNKKQELLNIYYMKEIKIFFEKEDLVKIPLNLRKLRENMLSEKGQWIKCTYTIDKDKKINVDFEYPEIK